MRKRDFFIIILIVLASWTLLAPLSLTSRPYPLLIYNVKRFMQNWKLNFANGLYIRLRTIYFRDKFWDCNMLCNWIISNYERFPSHWASQIFGHFKSYCSRSNMVRAWLLRAGDNSSTSRSHFWPLLWWPISWHQQSEGGRKVELVSSSSRSISWGKLSSGGNSLWCYYFVHKSQKFLSFFSLLL